MQQDKSFIKNIGAVSAITLLSRVMGFGRDLLLAGLFGNSVVADAFLFAYRFPALFRTLLIEEGFQAAFIPLYGAQEGQRAKAEFAGAILVTMFAISLAIYLPTVIFMNEIMAFLAPDFQQRDNAFPLLVLLARILFSYLLFLTISAIFVNLLQANRRFIASGALPLFLNGTLIVTMLLIAIFPEHQWVNLFHQEIIWLAIAVLLAGFIQVIFIIHAAQRAKLKLTIPLARAAYHPIGRFLRKILPIIIAKSSVQINFLINQLLIIGTVSGALATFYYAERMMHLPVGIFIIAITTVLLPDITAHIQSNQHRARLDAENRAFIGALLLSVPIMVGFIMLSAPIMLALFQRGAFDENAALASAQVLQLLAIGIPFIGIVKIQTIILFAHQNTKTPMQITIIGAVVNVTFALIFIHFFSYFGAALASSLSLIVQALLSLMILQRRNLYRIDKNLLMVIGKIILASLLMGLMLYLIMPTIQTFIDFDTKARLGILALLIFSGIFFYIGAILLMRIIKISDIQNFIRRKD